jgi:Na+/melibiose symporter-like transporter
MVGMHGHKWTQVSSVKKSEQMDRRQNIRCACVLFLLFLFLYQCVFACVCVCVCVCMCLFVCFCDTQRQVSNSNHHHHHHTHTITNESSNIRWRCCFFDAFAFSALLLFCFGDSMFTFLRSSTSVGDLFSVQRRLTQLGLLHPVFEPGLRARKGGNRTVCEESATGRERERSCWTRTTRGTNREAVGPWHFRWQLSQ